MGFSCLSFLKLALFGVSILNTASLPTVAAFRCSLPQHSIRNSMHRQLPTHHLLLGKCSDYGSLSAAAAVVCPAILGLKADQQIRSGIGPLVTILTAAHFTSLRISPTSHRFYDMCWTRFLPASLSLLLLSPSVGDITSQESINVEKAKKSTSKRKQLRYYTRREIKKMSIPFLIGCVGSVLGCLLSYLYCWLGKDNHNRVHKRILSGRKHFFFQPGHFLMEPVEAAVNAGCLLSSYIGGSANYFATAKAITMDQDLSLNARAGAKSVIDGTLGSAAADMLVLPIYYSALTFMASSRRLRRWFPCRRNYEHKDKVELERTETASTVSVSDQKSNSSKYSKVGLIIASIAPLAWSIVVVAEKIEQISCIPGSSVACVAMLSVTASKALSLIHNSNMKLDIGDIVQQLSDICYYTLLSAIGVSMNLRKLTLGGWWASSSSAIFALVPIIVHLAVMLAGSLGLERLFPNYTLCIREIIAASNAAICGPFTAAALVGQLSSGDKDDSSDIMNKRLKGLALAATFWGIVGYAMGTNIGLSLSKALLSRIELHADNTI